MHILILPSWYPSPYNELSGIFFKEQAEALAEFAKVGVISSQPISIKDVYKLKKINFTKRIFVDNNVETFQRTFLSIPKIKRIRYQIQMYYFKQMFNEYIKKNGLPDIVHAHSFIAGQWALWIKKKYDIPYVITEHSSGFIQNIYNRVEQESAKNVFYNASKRFAVSKEFVDFFIKTFNIHFDYLPNIVDIDFFSIKKNIKKENFMFINIAFLNKNKSQDMLIKSFSKAFKGKKNIKLLIVGDGPEYDNLNKLINNLNMNEQISLYGRASREEVRDLLHQSDVFVLSSKYETFGVVLIEAMACGLPVVSTKSGGPESIILSEQLGYLCEYDENELEKSLKKIYQNYSKFNPDLIRNYVVENFSKQKIAERLLNEYKSII